ncbi:hypothetical protein OTK49_03060 [Vibrio coralliirubri]|uniref:hypothetical protein n=1 Tax=Vibrio coralliirubri TaxID=1516159 RepID=UPI002284CF13|nr:hypothetical protein [Vibrio coralliirubri]MCY9861495.1 hypothetical protein [Vibrio coralliirubri]
MKSTRITVKAILKAVVDATGIKPEYVELGKFEGEYYWNGKSGSLFSGSNTYCRRLTDSTLEDWVDGYQRKVKETLEFTEYNHINELIESINWAVEYED